MAVVAASFWSTIGILHYWSAPQDPNANLIHIVEATYGDNCQGFVTPARYPNTARPGNATAAVSAACDNTRANCMFKIDVTQLGDPAVGCGKEFIARWRCGASQQIHEVYFPAEANLRIALIECQRW